MKNNLNRLNSKFGQKMAFSNVVLVSLFAAFSFSSAVAETTTIPTTTDYYALADVPRFPPGGEAPAENPVVLPERTLPTTMESITTPAVTTQSAAVEESNPEGGVAAAEVAPTTLTSTVTTDPVTPGPTQSSNFDPNSQFNNSAGSDVIVLSGTTLEPRADTTADHTPTEKTVLTPPEGTDTVKATTTGPEGQPEETAIATAEAAAAAPVEAVTEITTIETTAAQILTDGGTPPRETVSVTDATTVSADSYQPEGTTVSDTGSTEASHTGQGSAIDPPSADGSYITEQMYDTTDVASVLEDVTKPSVLPTSRTAPSPPDVIPDSILTDQSVIPSADIPAPPPYTVDAQSPGGLGDATTTERVLEVPEIRFDPDFHSKFGPPPPSIDQLKTFTDPFTGVEYMSNAKIDMPMPPTPKPRVKLPPTTTKPPVQTPPSYTVMDKTIAKMFEPWYEHTQDTRASKASQGSPGMKTDAQNQISSSVNALYDKNSKFVANFDTYASGPQPAGSLNWQSMGSQSYVPGQPIWQGMGAPKSQNTVKQEPPISATGSIVKPVVPGFGNTQSQVPTQQDTSFNLPIKQNTRSPSISAPSNNISAVYELWNHLVQQQQTNYGTGSKSFANTQHSPPLPRNQGNPGSVPQTSVPRNTGSNSEAVINYWGDSSHNSPTSSNVHSNSGANSQTSSSNNESPIIEEPSYNEVNAYLDNLLLKNYDAPSVKKQNQDQPPPIETIVTDPPPVIVADEYLPPPIVIRPNDNPSPILNENLLPPPIPSQNNEFLNAMNANFPPPPPPVIDTIENIHPTLPNPPVTKESSTYRRIYRTSKPHVNAIEDVVKSTEPQLNLNVPTLAYEGKHMLSETHSPADIVEPILPPSLKALFNGKDFGQNEANNPSSRTNDQPFALHVKNEPTPPPIIIETTPQITTATAPTSNMDLPPLPINPVIKNSGLPINPAIKNSLLPINPAIKNSLLPINPAIKNLLLPINPAIKNSLPVRDAVPETTTPEFTDAELMTIIRKIQNDSVLKEELPSSICDGCHYVNNVCFLTEGVCNRFITCVKIGVKVRAFEKECGLGNFWNPKALACQKSHYVDCPQDPCKDMKTERHPYHGRCQAYWKCGRGRSTVNCCSPGYRYSGIEQICVPDEHCIEECTINPKAIVVEPPKRCPLKAVPGSVTKFTDGHKTQGCAHGTIFDASQCACVTGSSNINTQVCKPDTVVDFEGSRAEAFKDKSGQNSGVGKQNVVLSSGRGLFYGSGRIQLWRYANVELGPYLAISIRFNPYGASNRNMTLLSNCNQSPIGATVDIKLNTTTNEVIYKLITTQKKDNILKTKYQPFAWNHAVIIYDGDSFGVSLNGETDVMFLQGTIPQIHQTISVGGCNRMDGYRGYIDDIKFYSTCIPRKFDHILFSRK